MDLNLTISQISATHFDVKHPSNSNANFVRFVVYISLKCIQMGQCRQWAGKELYIIKQGSQVSWWSFPSLIMCIDLKSGTRRGEGCAWMLVIRWWQEHWEGTAGNSVPSNTSPLSTKPCYQIPWVLNIGAAFLPIETQWPGPGTSLDEPSNQAGSEPEGKMAVAQGYQYSAHREGRKQVPNKWNLFA